MFREKYIRSGHVPCVTSLGCSYTPPSLQLFVNSELLSSFALSVNTKCHTLGSAENMKTELLQKILCAGECEQVHLKFLIKKHSVLSTTHIQKIQRFVLNIEL